MSKFNKKGFSALETAVVMGLTATMAMVGYTTSQELLPRFRTRQAAMEFARTIEMARQLAVTTSQETRVLMVEFDSDALNPDVPNLGQYRIQMGNKAAGSTVWDTLPYEDGPTDNLTGEGTVDISKTGNEYTRGVSLEEWGTIDGPGTLNADAIVFSPRGVLLNPSSDFAADGSLHITFVNKLSKTSDGADRARIRVFRGGMVRFAFDGQSELSTNGGTGFNSTTDNSEGDGYVDAYDDTGDVGGDDGGGGGDDGGGGDWTPKDDDEDVDEAIDEAMNPDDGSEDDSSDDGSSDDGSSDDESSDDNSSDDDSSDDSSSDDCSDDRCGDGSSDDGSSDDDSSDDGSSDDDSSSDDSSSDDGSSDDGSSDDSSDGGGSDDSSTDEDTGTGGSGDDDSEDEIVEEGDPDIDEYLDEEGMDREDLYEDGATDEDIEEYFGGDGTVDESDREKVEEDNRRRGCGCTTSTPAGRTSGGFLMVMAGLFFLNRREDPESADSDEA